MQPLFWSQQEVLHNLNGHPVLLLEMRKVILEMENIHLKFCSESGGGERNKKGRQITFLCFREEETLLQNCFSTTRSQTQLYIKQKKYYKLTLHFSETLLHDGAGRRHSAVGGQRALRLRGCWRPGTRCGEQISFLM